MLTVLGALDLGNVELYQAATGHWNARLKLPEFPTKRTREEANVKGAEEGEEWSGDGQSEIEDLEIVIRSEHMVVLDKPAGVRTEDAIRWLQCQIDVGAMEGGTEPGYRLQSVSRLDQPTRVLW